MNLYQNGGFLRYKKDYQSREGCGCMVRLPIQWGIQKKGSTSICVCVCVSVYMSAFNEGEQNCLLGYFFFSTLELFMFFLFYTHILYMSLYIILHRNGYYTHINMILYILLST